MIAKTAPLAFVIPLFNLSPATRQTYVNVIYRVGLETRTRLSGSSVFDGHVIIE